MHRRSGGQASRQERGPATVVVSASFAALLALIFASTDAVAAKASAMRQPSPQLSTNKYHVTEAERAACQQDATLLCSEAYPDEDLLLACMKAKRQQLTPACLVTFEAGLKRRHIPF